MKKNVLYLVSSLFMFVFTTAGAQNMMVNGDLEQWDDMNNPTGWTKAENISQGEDMVHSGTYSAMHTSADGTQDFQQEISNVSPGNNYTIRYYYYDNDPMARTRIWSYWTEGGSTLQDHEAELRPSSYSEDQDGWVMYEETLTAPPTADGFRFEVRVYKQDGNSGGSVYYDDFTFETAGVNPEPTNYPTNFMASADELVINLSWDDATGEQVPNGYVIFASDDQNIDPPLDGVPVDDDLDFSDGKGALNVEYGEESAMMNLMVGNTTFYFEIYPYTNGGLNVDYKTDGDPPMAEATTADIYVLNYENFNDATFGSWTQYSVTGDDQMWEIEDQYGIDNSPMASMSGFAGGAVENEDWLISPQLALQTGFSNPNLQFWNARNYDGPELEVKISTDYSGSGDPSSATWEDLTATLSQGDYEWVNSGDISLADYVPVNESFYVAFVYNSTINEAPLWEVDEILITSQSNVGVGENNDEAGIAVYPNPVNEILNIQMQEERNCRLEIFNMNGQVVYSDNFSGATTAGLSDLSEGVYMLRITTENKEVVKQEKLIVR